MNLISNFLLVLFLFISTAESGDPLYYLCSDDTKTTDVNQISSINNLLPTLALGTVNYGFIETSYGGEKNRFYGLAQCRSDVSKNDCASCIVDAVDHTRTQCANRADSKIWYDYCFLRYSANKFFDQVDTSGLYIYNVQNVSDPDGFNTKLAALMDDVSSQAIKPENKGLGKGKINVSSFSKLYALAQCTRDLSQINCAKCLAIAVSNFATVCGDKKGCKVLYSSCYVRYELYPFFLPLSRKESLKHSSEKFKIVMTLKH